MAKKKVRRVAKTLDQQYLGEEPILADDYTLGDLTRAYNWYNYFADRKTPRKYISEYARKFKFKNVADAIKKLDDFELPRAASFLCRMCVNGTNLQDQQKEFKNDALSECIELAKKKQVTVVKTPTAQVISIQDRVKEKAGEIIGEVEDIIDQMVVYKTLKEFNMYEWLQHNEVKPMVAKFIADYYEPNLQEIEEVLAGKDEQLNEAYSWMTKKEQRNYKKLLQGIIDDVNNFGSNQRKVRAPRKKQPKTTQQILKNLKYQPEDTTLKIASVDPAKLIGALELWAFNTKHNVLEYYVASDRGGLTVKGTTLQNWSTDQSIKRKVRKPDDFLPMIIKGGPKAIIKRFNDLATKPSTCNGRIGENTVLLRVTK